MTVLSKASLDKYTNFLAAMDSVTKTVKVEITHSSLENLKNNKYVLCFAKKVGDTYNVVWSSSSEYLSSNSFSWQPQYQLFGTNTFSDSVQVAATTNSQPIRLGQACILDSIGYLGDASEIDGVSGELTMINNYGNIHPGVSQVCTPVGSTQQVSTPIYVAPNAAVLGSVNLTPKESVLVWFQQNIETSTMFSDAKGRSIEIDLTNVNSHTVQYGDDQTWKQLA